MYCTRPQYVFLQNYKYTINCVSTLISKLFCASATLIRKLEMKTLSCLFFNLIAYLNYKHTCIHTYNIYLQTASLAHINLNYPSLALHASQYIPTTIYVYALINV